MGALFCLELAASYRLRGIGAGLRFQSRDPLTHDAGHLDEHVLLAFARAFEGAEAVIGSVEQVECRAFTELLGHGLQKIKMSQFVARTAEKEHWNRDGAEVVCALRLRFAGMMQGKGEEDQTFYTIERGF